jgi:GTP cyclohydrolase II
MKYSKTAKYPTKYGVFHYICARTDEGAQHSALWMGDVQSLEPLLLRIQSSCLTSTALGGLICDCAEQIEKSFGEIATTKRGILLYLDQEGRGHGLLEKVNTMYEMNAGADTVSAFTSRGLMPDIRDYHAVGELLKHLAIAAPLICMSNNPTKVEALKSMGFVVSERRSVLVASRQETINYLRTKREKLGHEIPE